MSMVARAQQEPGVAPGLREALRSLMLGAAGEGELWRLGDAEITDALGVIGQVRALLEIAEVDVVREGLQRGLPSESAWSAHDWVTRAEGQRACDPGSLHVASVVRVAQAGAPAAGPSALKAPGAVNAMKGAFAAGELPLGKADQLARFHKQVAAVADEEMLDTEMAILVEGAKDDVVETGPEGRLRERVRGLTDKELAAAITRTGRLLKPDKDLEDDDRRAKRGRSLTKSDGPAGMSLYRLLLEPEGAAVVDSALAALAGPVKGPGGEPDERSAAQRRADALVEVLRRGVSSPGSEPKCDKAQVVVTIGLDDLYEGTHGAGVTSTGEVLPPSVVRRMACDAGIIPVVLGGDSEVLDLGRAVRWFTPGQKRAIWLRDGGCTYPGCTMPPQWCDAHHVDWWSRGGRSDVSNGALLCPRHHTLVHTRDLTATITATGVTWHV